jgi:hypothetical protein
MVMNGSPIVSFYHAEGNAKMPQINVALVRIADV